MNVQFLECCNGTGRCSGCGRYVDRDTFAEGVRFGGGKGDDEEFGVFEVRSENDRATRKVNAGVELNVSGRDCEFAAAQESCEGEGSGCFEGDVQR